MLLLQWQNPCAQTTLSQYDITAYYNILLYCTRVYTVIFLPGNLKTHNIIDSVAAKRLVISDFVCLYKISNRVIDPSARLLMFPYIILYIYCVICYYRTVACTADRTTLSQNAREYVTNSINGWYFSVMAIAAFSVHLHFTYCYYLMPDIKYNE